MGQVREFMPPLVAIADEDAAADMSQHLGSVKGVEILSGPQAMETLARDSEADMVLNAMVGAIGLGSSLAALQSGKTLALANKESLVVGGELVMDLVKGEPDRLIPVDSEHSALMQCLRGERRDDLTRVIITASGGPFRGWTREELAKASVKEALAHPTWHMGPKITIDSATLMNKGLEVIEAHYLFGLDYNRIDVVVHPESVIHGIAELSDGSMIAQMASADMRLPIQLALAYPDRLGQGIKRLNLPELGRLTFEELDREAFPAVELAYRAGKLGLTYPAALNAANEVAVMAFLEGKVRLIQIPEVVAAVIDEHEAPAVVSEVALERADRWARNRAAEFVEGL
jgi:1-deoxy-D-xylulose-5-phosphate reductoisomerase